MRDNEGQILALALDSQGKILPLARPHPTVGLAGVRRLLAIRRRLRQRFQPGLKLTIVGGS
jgi:hypothetical protein